jgi:hypothetical protein
VSHRPHDVLTATGLVTHTRAYYHCPTCGTGHCPADDTLRLRGRYSPAAEQLVALAGALDPFGQADDLLQRLAGLRVSAASCRRLTEAAGQRLANQHAAATPVRSAPNGKRWHFALPDRDGQQFPGTVGYVGLDAFAVPTRADGGVAWRMLYVGRLYDPAKTHAVYVSGFDHEQVAATLRSYAIESGYGRAETVVALTDGGNGLEPALRREFSGALVCVLDFWHACEHLYEFARAWHGRDSPAGHAWAEEAKERMRRDGGTGLLKWLEALTLPADAPTAVGEALTQLRGFVGRQAHRMDYPDYRAKGWDIGSGPVEAGCKVLGGRVKGAGMRWGEPHAAEVAGLRGLYASRDGRWDQFWFSPTQADN